LNILPKNCVIRVENVHFPLLATASVVNFGIVKVGELGWKEIKLNSAGVGLTNKKYQIIVEKFDDLKDKNG
jgi:hypothetical protein